MKLTNLAVVMAALFAASANAAVLYDKDGTTVEMTGRSKANFYNDAATDNSSSTIDGDVRLGFKGSTAITDDLKGIARVEWQVKAQGSDEDDLKVRHAYAGFDAGDYGTIVFGQTETAFYDVVGATDVFNEWGSYGNSYWGYRDGGPNFGGRQEGQAVYHVTYGALTGGLSYISSDDSANLDYGYAGALTYAFDFGLGIGATAQKFESLDSLADQQDWAINATWGSYGDGLYLAGLYNQSKQETAGVEEKIKSYELAALYFQDNWGLLSGFNYSKNHDTDVELTNEFILGAQYNFTSNFFTYTEYVFDQRDNADDLWTLALQYNF
ncbi:MAG: porin [Aeromonadaceae bacterium]|nr:porin [Aeromonadaceae bacterium]